MTATGFILAAQSARITAALERIVTPPIGGRVIASKIQGRKA